MTYNLSSNYKIFQVIWRWRIPSSSSSLSLFPVWTWLKSFLQLRVCIISHSKPILNHEAQNQLAIICGYIIIEVIPGTSINRISCTMGQKWMFGCCKDAVRCHHLYSRYGGFIVTWTLNGRVQSFVIKGVLRLIMKGKWWVWSLVFLSVVFYNLCCFCYIITIELPDTIENNLVHNRIIQCYWLKFLNLAI